jgi:hypothetical protein
MTNHITKPEQSLSPQPKDAQFFGPETEQHYASWYKKEDGDWLSLLCNDKHDVWERRGLMPESRINELVSLKETAMTNKHPHAEMIKAKVDDMGLVVFAKYDDKWIKVNGFPDWYMNEYFICLPKHKEVVLHALNGGEVQYKGDDSWAECVPYYGDDVTWHNSWWYMDENTQTRIKPRKEKRWIGANGNSLTTQHYASRDELIASILKPSEWKCVEVELEV